MTTSRTFRLFISSTFSDMGHERRVLHAEVFPRLRALCASRGARFQAVDLRWGVNESSQLDHRTMDICLGEIERCQRLSPRPNFHLLLGDRYGWEPPPARIPSKEFSVLYAKGDESEQVQLGRWYRQDDNAVPPEHVLVPRTDEYVDYEAWGPVEVQLRDILRRCADAAGLKGKTRAKYFYSATHQEIIKGAQSMPEVTGNDVDPAEHVLACFRTIKGVPRDTPHLYFDDRDEQLDKLKEAIQARLGQTAPETENVYVYGAAWDEAAKDIRLSDEDDFAAVALAHFERVITADLDSLAEVSALEAERAAQCLFRDDRCAHFVGRKKELNRIDAYLGGDSRQVLAVVGPGGSGKSSLMAEVTRRAEEGEGIVVYRFIGSTAGSTLLDGMLRSVAEELGAALDESGSIPTIRDELLEHLEGLLGKATSQRPITVILDALDQLTESDARRLDWLLDELPVHAKMVVSLLPSLAPRLAREIEQFTISAMTKSQGKTLLKAWLAQAARTLQSNQSQAILDAFSERGLPLYLRLAFEQARTWRSWQEAQVVPTDIEGMIAAVLDQLEQDHTPQKGDVKAPFVQTALGYLQASRHGLSEDELLDVLAQDDGFFEAYEQTTHHALSERRIPIAVWSRLYLDLAPYLVEREAQGAVVLGFFHRQIGEYIDQRYGLGDSKGHSHAGLSAYFVQQDNHRDGQARKQPNGRKLAELPYQQLHAEKWEELEATLTDFDLLMATCQAGLHEQLVGDMRLADAALLQVECDTLSNWADFLRSIRPLLPNATDEWHGGRILLQLALEESLDSNPNRKSREWLESQTTKPLLLKYSRNKSAVENRARIIRAHSGRVTGVLELQDGSRQSDSEGGPPIESVCQGVLSWSDLDGTLRLWDAEEGVSLGQLTGHENAISGALQFPQGRNIVSWAQRGFIKLWDPETELSYSKIGPGISGAIQCGRGLFFWAKNRAFVLQLQPLKLVHRLDAHDEPILGAIVLRSGHVLTWSADRTLRTWDTDSGECLHCMSGHENPVGGVLELHDGRIVTWTGHMADPQLRIWDLQTGKCSSTLGGHNDLVQGAMQPDDEHLVTWGEPSAVRVWHLATGEMVEDFEGWKNRVQGVLHLGNGRLVGWGRTRGNMLLAAPTEFLRAKSMDDASIRVWSLGQSDDCHVLRGHTSTINGVIPYQDNSTLISWSDDSTIRMWDLETMRCTWISSEHSSKVRGAQFLSNGDLLSWSDDGKLCFQRVVRTQVQEGAIGHHSVVRGAAFIRNDKVVTWSDDHTIRTWSAQTGSPIEVLRGHTYLVEGVSELPDGKLLSWSTDGTMRHWDADSGKELACWEKEVAPQDYQDIANTAGRWHQPMKRGDGGTTLHVVDTRVQWSAFGEWCCWAVRPDGTLLMSSGSRFEVVHLFRGLERIGHDSRCL